MKNRTPINRLTAALLALALGTVNAVATDGSWSAQSGNWSTTTNWTGGVIADGVGASAMFTLGVSGNRSFTIDNTSRTLGALILGENRSCHINASGGAVLILDNNGSPSQVTQTTTAGNNFYIDVPIQLNGDLYVTNERYTDSAKHLNFGTITNTSAGDVTITNNSGVQPAGGTVNFLNVISDGTSGTVSIYQDNKGTAAIYALNLAVANTYNGSTTLKSGYLNLQHANAIQNSTLIMSGGRLQMNSAGGTAFNFGGLSATTNGTGYDIALQNSAAAAVALNVGNNNASTTYAGALSAGGSLTKVGNGTLTLSNTNTYTGNTTVSSGTLLVDGSLAAGSAVSVNNATLGGSGTINGALTVNAGGTIQPSTSGNANTLTFANSAEPTYSTDYATLRIRASDTALDSVAFSAATAHSVANLDLHLDCANLSGPVSGATIYSVASGDMSSTAFHSVTLDNNLSGYTPTVHYNTTTITVDLSGGGSSTHTIAVSAGPNGSISPSGPVTVNHGESQSFTITANAHHLVADVLVDGSSVGAVTSYTFTGVTASHTIAATFAAITHTVTTSAGSNGSISPSGAVIVTDGADQSFTITPGAHYTVTDVLVDGSSVGAVTDYTFTNVTADHSIAASFAPIAHRIAATAGANGSISPNGAVSVNDGANQIFTMSPDTNYEVADLWVDGASVGAVASYTFTNVTADHTISASFGPAMPPTPDPATFAVAPTALSTTAITMTATTGTDPSGPVQYLFTEATGHPGGASSGWQTSPTYTNTGLQPATRYSYTVTLRDSLGSTGTPSAAASATTPDQIDTFTNQSALAWDTGNTSPSKTVHMVCPNSGVEFDLTLATDMGNLLIGDYQPDGVSYLADSGGINGTGWFEGTLTITADNFTGATLSDISFQLVDVSGRRLVTDTINFTSTATPTMTPIGLGTPWNTDAAFSNVALDSTPANMAGGQYVATLAWKHMDAESSGLYHSFSFKVDVAAAPTGQSPQITSITPVGGGVWELTFAGQPNTSYEFRSSTTLTFSPGTLVENLTQGNPGIDPGTIGGTNNSVFTTDGSGNAKVRVTLTGNPADFVRAQTAP
ncbi:MAG: autotransporter-associated beta strand repeat-containing protein [Verrucomicrobia bacterium]|nr:autotransporter-associated beta strand repeat-containing protein [Verrucomicrobiota bacterium]